MEQTVCSETSAYKIQKPENHPKESVQRSGHSESLKSRILSLSLSLSLYIYIYIYIIYSIFPLTPLYSELFLLVLPFRRFSSFPSLMLQPFQETILQNTSWYGAEFSQYFDMDPNAGKVHSFLTYRITLCWSIN